MRVSTYLRAIGGIDHTEASDTVGEKAGRANRMRPGLFARSVRDSSGHVSKGHALSTLVHDGLVDDYLPHTLRSHCGTDTEAEAVQYVRDLIVLDLETKTGVRFDDRLLDQIDALSDQALEAVVAATDDYFDLGGRTLSDEEIDAWLDEEPEAIEPVAPRGAQGCDGGNQANRRAAAAGASEWRRPAAGATRGWRPRRARKLGSLARRPKSCTSQKTGAPPTSEKSRRPNFWQNHRRPKKLHVPKNGTDLCGADPNNRRLLQRQGRRAVGAQLGHIFIVDELETTGDDLVDEPIDEIRVAIDRILGRIVLDATVGVRLRCRARQEFTNAGASQIAGEIPLNRQRLAGCLVAENLSSHRSTKPVADRCCSRSGIRRCSDQDKSLGSGNAGCSAALRWPSRQ